MAGIGKEYTKGKKFTLRSGNNPVFKMMGNVEAGDSPITKGKSPYEQNYEITGTTGNDDTSNIDTSKQSKVPTGSKVGKILGTAAEMFRAGINNVYGTPSATGLPGTSGLDAETLKKQKEELQKKIDEETASIIDTDALIEGS